MTVASKAALSNYGLGPLTIQIAANDESVQKHLLERFPLLADAGGFELLLYQRGGNDQGFHVINPPHSAV